MDVWKGIGLLVGGYTLISVLRGEVQAKNGIHMDTISRTTQPGRFWGVIALYSALTAALFTVF